MDDDFLDEQLESDEEPDDEESDEAPKKPVQKPWPAPRDRFWPGAAGALGGALAGAALMALLSRVGLFGTLMGAGISALTILFYEKLGGRLHAPGAVLCGLLIAAAVWAGHRAGLALAIVSADVSFFRAFSVVPQLLRRGYLDSTSYFLGLIVAALLAAGTAAPIMVRSLREGRL